MLKGLSSMTKCSLFRALMVAVGMMTTAVIATPAHALVEIKINKGNVEHLPIAIHAFIETISNPDAAPRFEDWKVINAQALVTGRVTQEADGRLRAEFRLWDTFAGSQMTGQQFYTQPENWRRVAHIIADAIYKQITGEEGYFDTRVVFVSESGTKQERKRQLAIMDQDGFNIRMLSDGSDLV